MVAAILLDLEHDLVAPVRRAALHAFRCELCGEQFEWPGLLQAHRDRADHYLQFEAA
jgi:hypothetical protein